jgi:ribosome-binding protein aMBF1 (putative translation factor)
MSVISTYPAILKTVGADHKGRKGESGEMETMTSEVAHVFGRPRGNKTEDAEMNNDLERQFGERIKHLRISVSMSQEELSFRSGLHRNYISDVERGRRNISLKALNKLAKGLGITMRDLF